MWIEEGFYFAQASLVSSPEEDVLELQKQAIEERGRQMTVSAR